MTRNTLTTLAFALLTFALAHGTPVCAHGQSVTTRLTLSSTLSSSDTGTVVVAAKVEQKSGSGFVPAVAKDMTFQVDGKSVGVGVVDPKTGIVSVTCPISTDNGTDHQISVAYSGLSVSAPLQQTQVMTIHQSR